MVDNEQNVATCGFTLQCQNRDTLSMESIINGKNILRDFSNGHQGESLTDLFSYEQGQGDNISNISTQVSPKKRKLDNVATCGFTLQCQNRDTLSMESIINGKNILRDFSNGHQGESLTDLFSYEQGQGDNISNISTQVSPKKRKLDKDGFVTPATPDIPKSSCHYGQPSISRIPSADDTEHKQEENSEADEDEQKQAATYLAKENAVVTVPPDQADQSLTPAGDLVKDLGEETKNAFTQFSKLFKEREEYEMMCPEKLDKLLEQARTLEDSLKQQKDILCNRLKALSQTLKLL